MENTDTWDGFGWLNDKGVIDGETVSAGMDYSYVGYYCTCAHGYCHYHDYLHPMMVAREQRDLMEKSNPEHDLRLVDEVVNASIDMVEIALESSRPGGERSELRKRALKNSARHQKAVQALLKSRETNG